METDDVQAVDAFVRLMKPLVPDGRMAMEFVGAPERKKEKDMAALFLQVAQKHKLHRKLSHCRAGIRIVFGEDTSPFSMQETRPMLYLRVNTMTREDYERRRYILLSLVVLVALLALYRR